MKITQRGIIGKRWVCLCGNTSDGDGFYPVNFRGDLELHLWRGSKWYACFHCGRIIERTTLNVVGATRYHKLTGGELLAIYLDLQSSVARQSQVFGSKRLNAIHTNWGKKST